MDYKLNPNFFFLIKKKDYNPKYAYYTSLEVQFFLDFPKLHKLQR